MSEPTPIPLADEPVRTPQRVVVPRWIQLVLLPLGLLAAYRLLLAAGPVALLLIVAGLVALLLNPFVALLRRRGLPRGLSVALVFLTLVVVIGGVGALVAAPVGDQVSSFQSSVPEFVDQANGELASLQEWLDARGIGVEVTAQGQTALQTLGEQVAKGSGDVVAFTRDALTILVEASLALILIIVLSVYLLLYGEKIGAGVRSVVPRGDGSADDDYPTQVQRAVFGYVRGQLLFSVIMGASAGVMLYVLGTLGIFEEGKTYALFFGLFYGFAELIPYVGPAVGAAPPVFLCLLGGDPLDAVWLTIGFTVLQQLEGHVVAPQVFGHSLRINPVLVILALLMGGRLYGFAGAFIALPIAAILRESLLYARRHLVLEQWSVVRPAGATPAQPAPATEPSASASTEPATVDDAAEDAPRNACPECGASMAPRASECPSCGTEVATGDAAAGARSGGPA